jgi:hypothetical protein
MAGKRISYWDRIVDSPTTEPERKICTDPRPILEVLRGKVRTRKLRLVTVGCCHRLLPFVSDQRAEHILEVATFPPAPECRGTHL